MESIVSLHKQACCLSNLSYQNSVCISSKLLTNEKILLEEREQLQKEIAAIEAKRNEDNNNSVIGNSNHAGNNASLHLLSPQAILHLLQ
ncbi:hypothetical protein PanWU01x14_222330 [Parasponia andersonii]|uniref:Uncharacterized protein n=1 Tax=Parasponia andersonii TaxID=3476 RepID=A0A2P5BPK9_PARAD|nr:hypothetical protein PanWU01x14_222330 [Parasponia andersonii]